MRAREVCKITLLLGFVVLVICAPVYQESAKIHGQELSWQPPPQTSVKHKRSAPKLINYAHRHDILEYSGVANIEKRLAQWDIIILNPDHNLSLGKIRETNPYIKILVWIPLQGPHPSLRLYQGFKPNWYCKTASGNTLIMPWDEPLANLYADNYGYIYHILEYLEKYGQSYDGVLYDCMWEYPWKGADINEDGIVNSRDTKALQSATVTLLKETRDLFPEWIITGNGGTPWSEGSEYYRYANGNMHENALGDKFGDPSWSYLWQGYQRVTRRGQEPAYHFINVDIRAKGRSLSQAKNLYSLTKDDLRRMRLGLVGSMLLDSGYFGFDRGDCLHGQLWWFDEYNVDLGNPLGPYRKNIYSEGDFSREFENGLVILNNSYWSIHVTFEESYVDVSVGKEGTRFEIPSQDARIFLKKGFE